MYSPTDRAKFFQQNLSGAATAAASLMITSDNLSSPRASAPSSISNLSPSEGRVSKPPHARRRSRASSTRTPTTLLNTDTTNFRAMVQQFTGDPNVSFASTQPAQTFGFGLGAAGNLHAPHHHNLNPNPNISSSLMFSPGYRLQYQPDQYQGQGYMISMSNDVNNHAAAGDGFFQRLGGNPRPLQPPLEGSDGFLMEMNNATSTSRAPSNSSENRGNGFMF